MSDLTTSELDQLISARALLPERDVVDEPILPARHVVAVTLLMIAATALALLIQV